MPIKSNGSGALAAQVAANTSALSAMKAPTTVTVDEDKTFALSDADTFQLVTADAELTVPPNSSVAFPLKTQITVFTATADAVSFNAGPGVTIRSDDDALYMDGAYVSATLIKMDTDEWYLIGKIWCGQ